MIIVYARSSSLGTYEMCPMQYLLSYQLGIPSKPNYKTEMGSVVHKSLELLAGRKLAEQEGRDTFSDQELGRDFPASITVEESLEAGWLHYTTKNESGHAWTEAEKSQCRQWVDDVLTFNDGMFSPLKRDVVMPEQYFDLPIDEPWARYRYVDPHSGKPLEGQLAIRGTVDLLTRLNSQTLELLDWKSGRPMWDWAKDKLKTHEDLEADTQLLLYFYALTRLYPQYRDIMVTIFYAQAKSPTTLCYERDRHIPRVLDMLRKKFDAIRLDDNPKRIKDNQAKAWKCKAFCYFGRTKYQQSDKVICDHIHGELQHLGMQRVTVKYGKANSISQYGSGGGVSNRDSSPSLTTKESL